MKKVLLSLSVIGGSLMYGQIQEMVDDAKSEITTQTQKATDDAIDRGWESLRSATWGIRANAMINTSSLGQFSDIKELKDSGFNVGISAIVNLSKSEKFFFSPELYYTYVGNSQLDMPILFGYKIGESVGLVAGPSLSYTFSQKSSEHAQTLVQSAITGDYKGLASTLQFGYQAGLQAYFGSFMVSAKYDGSITGKALNFVNEGTGKSFQEKMKSSYLSVGVGYNFGK